MVYDDGDVAGDEVSERVWGCGGYEVYVVFAVCEVSKVYADAGGPGERVSALVALVVHVVEGYVARL